MMDLASYIVTFWDLNLATLKITKLYCNLPFCGSPPPTTPV